jgi:hypothetical protein
MQKSKTTLDKTSVQKPKLLDQVKTLMRVKYYSKKTEEAYTNWVANECLNVNNTFRRKYILLR